jgi:hypothetical protein
MGKGTCGYKKGNTYNWPIAHLADAYDEVTPRSFLGMMTAAAAYGVPPDDRAITAEGIRHGLRAASKIRVAARTADLDNNRSRAERARLRLIATGQ